MTPMNPPHLEQFSAAEQAQKAYDALLAEVAALKQAILTDEQRTALAEIDYEYLDKLAVAAAKLETAKNDLKAVCSTPIKGQVLQMTITKPGHDWDHTGLFSLAGEVPAIMAHYRQTNPIKRIARVTPKC